MSAISPPLICAPKPLRAWVNPSLHPIGCIGQGTVAEIAEAEAWLRGQGCTHARGPLEGSTWGPYRANLGPSTRPTFLGEPTFSPEPWVARGYEVAAHYASWLVPNAPYVAKAAQRSARLVAAGWSLRRLDELGSFDHALDLFHQLSSRAFTGAFSYSPLPLDGFKAIYAPFEGRVDPRMILVAMGPDGEPGGYIFSLPDILNPNSDVFIIKTLAVDPAHRREGIGSWLVSSAHAVADGLGFTGGGIHALMWEGSHSQKVAPDLGEPIRRYALYQRALTEPAR